MTTEEINSKSEIINQNIYSILNLYKKLDSVGLFYPFNNEVNILDLCNRIELDGITVALPVVKSKSLPLDYKVFNFQAHNVTKGFGGILEPIHSPSLDPDIIIVSCAAFNLEGYRVGYGGGFFDRTIEKLKKKNKNFLTILAAFDMQQYNSNFQEKFDQKVDYICTENKIIKL